MFFFQARSLFLDADLTKLNPYKATPAGQQGRKPIPYFFSLTILGNPKVSIP